MKVIIAGGRNFDDYGAVIGVMESRMEVITEVVSGCARGADTLGERWATQAEIPVKRFPADWNAFGKSAGSIRNKEMAEYADAAVVFWDGVSRGTKNMIGEMHKLKKPIKIVYYQ